MNKHLRFCIAGKPKTPLNKIFKTGNKRFVSSKVGGEAWRSAVEVAGRDAVGSMKPLVSPVRLEVTINRKLPKSFSQKKCKEALAGFILPTTRPDADNGVKLMCDSLNGILYKDDSQIVDLTIRKRYANSDYVEVEIWELGINE